MYLRVSSDAAPQHYFFSRSLRDALPQPIRPDTLYLFSHSLAVFIAVFGVTWLVRRRLALAMLAWPLHILMDIPSHRAGMYGTPFLWPFSSYRFDGVSWGRPRFMLLNYTLIASAYLLLFAWWLFSSRRSRSQKSGRERKERCVGAPTAEGPSGN